MIGVASFPVRDNDRARAKLTDDASDRELVLAGGLHVGIGDAEGSAPGNFQDSRGEGCFFGADFRIAACAHFAGSEIEDSGLVTLGAGFEERAAAGEFDVVGMGGNGEKVERHECLFRCREIVRVTGD